MGKLKQPKMPKPVFKENKKDTPKITRKVRKAMLKDEKKRAKKFNRGITRAMVVLALFSGVLDVLYSKKQQKKKQK